jgi:uncharacterized membrane protein
VFVPVVTTAIVALLLSREQAAPLAYIGGSLGTLIGADLLNLGNIRGWLLRWLQSAELEPLRASS